MQIKQICKELNCTIKELAQAIGLSEGRIKQLAYTDCQMPLSVQKSCEMLLKIQKLERDLADFQELKRILRS